jgi:DnaJ-class molecular chaperone
LYITKKTTLLQALTGFELLLPTLDETRQLCVVVDEVIQPGQCKAIDNAGMPLYDPTVKSIQNHKLHKHGKMIVVFQVVFPQHLNRELKGYLKLLLDPKTKDLEKIPPIKDLQRLLPAVSEEKSVHAEKVEKVKFMTGEVSNPYDDGTIPEPKPEDSENAEVKEKRSKKSRWSSYCAQQ